MDGTKAASTALTVVVEWDASWAAYWVAELAVLRAVWTGGTTAAHSAVNWVETTAVDWVEQLGCKLVDAKGEKTAGSMAVWKDVRQAAARDEW